MPRVKQAEECRMILANRPRAVAVELQSQITRRKFVSSMEKNANVQVPETREYFHYNHTDSCKFSRWNSRESYVFMYARPWQKVVHFYSNLVNGHTTLLQSLGTKTHQIPDDASIEPCESEVVITPEKRAGRWARANFKIVLSYHGGSFDGWQKQPGLNTVQAVIEKSLGKFVDEKKAAVLRDKDLPLEGTVVVAGRTDKGVTGFHQVCSFYEPLCFSKFLIFQVNFSLKVQLHFYLRMAQQSIGRNVIADCPGHDKATSGELMPSNIANAFESQLQVIYTWREDVRTQDIEDAINSTIPGKLRVISVSQVSRSFHSNFSAKWRRYLYIFPLNDGETEKESRQSEEDTTLCFHEKIGDQENNKDDFVGEGSLESAVDDKDDLGSIKKPTSGPPTECFIFHARATQVSLTIDKEKGESIEAMCIELVANSFLRKMVRVLVATSIREAAAGAEDDALIKLMDATCRRATAPPAPPHGLCLVNVGVNFEDETCSISLGIQTSLLVIIFSLFYLNSQRILLNAPKIEITKVFSSAYILPPNLIFKQDMFGFVFGSVCKICIKSYASDTTSCT
ncbi:hypothetical protein Ccrd_025063 [Cynara cardunculus var. scolymus]|uniref:Pseudouridine synthase I TruA alpha/beta domain-containing protein n=1 Tax=Cynara cardunculus var. scolymus TaxID=59895 RepID=A0A124SAJ2_CYNCS|nr:hypothetical protein Ccrd_025063 [Cynara cardunculus var. scolymus]